MFLLSGTVSVLAGAIGLITMSSWRAIFPGVLTPIILIGGGGILLLFSVAHYLVSKLTAAQMSRPLAAITLGIALAGMGFYLASARSMEAALDSSAPTGDAVVRHMIRSELCGVLAVTAFLLNAIVTFRKRRSLAGVSPS
jgi:hypothetical protein